MWENRADKMAAEKDDEDEEAENKKNKEEIVDSVEWVIIIIDRFVLLLTKKE